MQTRKIIFDTDPGIDDAMALLFAHYSPAIDLLGITTVLGNGSIETTTRNALYIAERFDMEQPVHRGAGAPLQVAEDEIPTFVHGDNGLGNIALQNPARTTGTTTAAQYIVDSVTAAPGEITLVAVGRMTNLALALQLDPSIAGKVREVVIMGGALGANQFTGNVSPVAEANIYGDPHAADLVFTAGWPVALVGLDVTMTCVMDRRRLERIRNEAGDAGSFIWDITRFYENFYRQVRGTDGFPVHDSCALIYAIAPELFTVNTGPIRVPADGITRGQTIQVPSDHRFGPSAWDDAPDAMGCVGVNAEAVLDLYEQTLLNQQLASSPD